VLNVLVVDLLVDVAYAVIVSKTDDVDLFVAVANVVVVSYAVVVVLPVPYAVDLDV
jgi:hypothetical protein